MLKEKRKQGLIAGIVFAIFFLLLALGAFFMRYSDAHPEFLHKDDAYYVGDSSKGETVYLEIYDISPSPIGQVDNDTEIWLVAYKDGYTGLQAKKNDAQIAKLVKQAGQLAEKPAKLVGKLYRTSSAKDGVIKNYSSNLSSALTDLSDIRRQTATSTYVSLSEFNSQQLFFLIIILIMSALAIFILIGGMITSKRNSKSYDKLYEAYPELQGNLDHLLEEAQFHDELLKIVIYKHHLITYNKGFFVTDLQQVRQIYHYVLTTYSRGFVANRQSFLTVIPSNGGKKYNMNICNLKKKTDQQLQATFEYLAQNYPNIQLGT